MKLIRIKFFEYETNFQNMLVDLPLKISAHLLLWMPPMIFECFKSRDFHHLSLMEKEEASATQPFSQKLRLLVLLLLREKVTSGGKVSYLD